MNAPSAAVPIAGGPSTAALPPAVWRWAIAIGIATGVAYALSPMTVLVAVGFVPLFRWTLRDLPAGERRWVRNVLVAGVALRVLAIAALFATADRSQPFAVFFGDELFFLLRGWRLYNIWMGTPIAVESFIYAYDKTGYASYQDLLVFLQILFGPLPYGIHLLNALLFVTGIAVLFRLVRDAFGPAAALVGLGYALFLPSLFMWSVSALKESLYLFAASIVVASSVAAVRQRGRVARAVAILIVVGGGWWLESLRTGGRVIALAGAAVAYGVRAIALRRWAIAATAVAAILAAAMVVRYGLPNRVQQQMNLAARYHRGHVFTRGHSYKLLDESFYTTKEGWMALRVPEMTGDETARFAVRAVVHFVVEPIPWRIESLSELAYMPEQAIWLMAVALLPIGLAVGWRRDALVTCMLAGHSLVSAGVIAINSGNIGTMIRHRALVAPFFCWISALGFVWVIAALRSKRALS